MKEHPTFGGERLTAVQLAMLGAPEFYIDPDTGKKEPLDIAAITGRGWGKSTGALAKVYQFATRYPDTEIAIFRQTSKSLKPLRKSAQKLFGIEDRNMSFNKQEGLLTLSNGSTIVFDALADLSLYQNHQGANYQMIFCDEVQQWGDPELIDMLLSNLRGGVDGQPCFMMYGGNPGDAGHYWMVDRWVSKRRPKIDVYRSKNGRPTILFQGNYQDNVDPKTGKNNNGENYAATLAKSTTDAALLEMWLSGDVTIVGGCAFTGSLSHDNWVNWYASPYWYDSNKWRKYLALDHGTAAPAVVLGMAEARDTAYGPDDEIYCKGDLVAVWEMSTASPDNKNVGDGSSIAEICARTIEMCNDWNWPKHGVGDDSIFAHHGGPSTLAETYADHGLHIDPANKGNRISGWDMFKNLLSKAKPNGQRESAAYYINARSCPYLYYTIRHITPDPRNLADVNTASFDHAVDCGRYSITGRPQGGMTRTSLER